MSMKQVLDKGLNKIISRKLLVWVTASAFLLGELITADIWASISLGYVGLQGFIDAAVAWKHGPN